MNLFTHIANLITSVVRSEKTAFTTVIYPSLRISVNVTERFANT